MCVIRRQDFAKFNEGPRYTLRSRPTKSESTSLRKSQEARSPYRNSAGQHRDDSDSHSELKSVFSGNTVNYVASDVPLTVQTKIESQLLTGLEDKIVPEPSKSSVAINRPTYDQPLNINTVHNESVQVEVPGSSVPPSSTSSDTCKAFSVSSGPPNPSDVLDNLDAFNLRSLPLKQPFYGCPQDLPTAKGIGFTKVSVKSQFARDLEEHGFSLGRSMDSVQRAMHAAIFSSGAMAVPSANQETVLYALFSNRPVVITPLNCPPSHSVALEWLKNSKKSKAALEEESIKRPDDSKPDDVSVLTNIGTSSQSSVVFDSQISSDTQLSGGREILKHTQLNQEVSSAILSKIIYCTHVFMYNLLNVAHHSIIMLIYICIANII